MSWMQWLRNDSFLCQIWNHDAPCCSPVGYQFSHCTAPTLAPFQGHITIQGPPTPPNWLAYLSGNLNTLTTSPTYSQTSTWKGYSSWTGLTLENEGTTILQKRETLAKQQNITSQKTCIFKITYHFELRRRLWHVTRLHWSLWHAGPQLSTHPRVRSSSQCSNRWTLCNDWPALIAFRGRKKRGKSGMFLQQMS
jgi:hypothetical protein